MLGKECSVVYCTICGDFGKLKRPNSFFYRGFLNNNNNNNNNNNSNNNNNNNNVSRGVAIEVTCHYVGLLYFLVRDQNPLILTEGVYTNNRSSKKKCIYFKKCLK